MTACRTFDKSVEGVGIQFGTEKPPIEVGQQLTVTVDLKGQPIEMPAEVRWLKQINGRWQAGMKILLQDQPAEGRN